MIFCIQNLAEIKQAPSDKLKDLDKIESVQERYNKLEAALKEMGKGVSKCSAGNNMGNRNRETKKLIELRNKLRGKETKTPRERIELTQGRLLG